MAQDAFRPGEHVTLLLAYPQDWFVPTAKVQLLLDSNFRPRIAE